MPTAISAPDTTELANRLRPVLLKLNRELRREIHSLGVTGGQVSLLVAIKYSPGIGVRELAAQERMSVPGMSKFVGRLEEAGLVKVEPVAGDIRELTRWVEAWTGLEMDEQGIVRVLDGPAWRDHVRRVEDAGVDTFLIRDHFSAAAFGRQLAPFTALATAAAVTQRLRVGTLVLSNDFRHPAVLAHEAASLHHLSGGRFELGLGAGWFDTPDASFVETARRDPAAPPVHTPR